MKPECHGFKSSEIHRLEEKLNDDSVHLSLPTTDAITRDCSFSQHDFTGHYLFYWKNPDEYPEGEYVLVPCKYCGQVRFLRLKDATELQDG